NWYTGSVHVARASALKRAAEENIDMTDEKLLVGSYGSGEQAEVHTETVRDGWREEIAGLHIDDQLAARYDISFEEYEHIHDTHNHDKEGDIEAFTVTSEEFVRDGPGPMDERTYRYVE